MHWFYWSVLSAVFAACTAVLAKIGVANVDSNTAMALRTTVVFTLSWILVFALKGFATVRGIPNGALLAILASGVATGLSWLCYFKALQGGPVSKVGPIDKLSVVLLVIFGAVFLDEPMTLRTVAAVVLIAVGVLILATSNS